MFKQAISRFWPKSAIPADFYRSGKSKTVILAENAEISAADFRPDMAGKQTNLKFLESRPSYLSEKYILLGAMPEPHGSKRILKNKQKIGRL